MKTSRIHLLAKGTRSQSLKLQERSPMFRSAVASLPAMASIGILLIILSFMNKNNWIGRLCVPEKKRKYSGASRRESTRSRSYRHLPLSKIINWGKATLITKKVTTLNKWKWRTRAITTRPALTKSPKSQAYQAWIVQFRQLWRSRQSKITIHRSTSINRIQIAFRRKLLLLLIINLL